MTDYKALYEKQLEENKKLKEEAMDIDYCDVCEYLEYDPNDVIDKLKQDNHTIQQFIIEALGGKEFVGGEYPDDIKLRDIIECVEDLSSAKDAYQKELDSEHQRYLETTEKYSNKLSEVCQELDIENDDTSENIIKQIKKLKKE